MGDANHLALTVVVALLTAVLGVTIVRHAQALADEIKPWGSADDPFPAKWLVRLAGFALVVVAAVDLVVGVTLTAQ